MILNRFSSKFQLTTVMFVFLPLILLQGCGNNDTTTQKQSPASPSNSKTIQEVKDFVSEQASNSSQHPIPRIRKNPLIIGSMASPKKYDQLVDYLQSKLGVKIIVEGGEHYSYQEAKNQVAKKNWDIIFAGSPMLVVIAKDNQYSYAARMYPQYPPYYSAALFVRQNSRIQSLADINKTTILALGDPNSTSTYYMPLYDLYGKELQISVGNKQIYKMVKEGKADIGSGTLDTVKKKTEFRILSESRMIPGGGVYLSPKLSTSDQNLIKKALLNAEPRVQEQSNYGKSKEVDYSQFRIIVYKTEKLLQCVDFNHNPVKLFCSKSPRSSSQNQPHIAGRVNGFSFADSKTVYLTLAAENRKIYRVVVAQQLLNTIPDAPPPQAFNDKRITVVGVKPVKKGTTLELRITQPEQLQIAN